MITARRAAQLKNGMPSVLDPEDRPKTRNTVTIAMKEVRLGRIKWGDDLPTNAESQQDLERERAKTERPSYSPAFLDED
jgi:DNA-directed RNA polymerase subunit K/omega